MDNSFPEQKTKHICIVCEIVYRQGFEALHMTATPDCGGGVRGAWLCIRARRCAENVSGCGNVPPSSPLSPLLGRDALLRGPLVQLTSSPF